MSVAVLFGTGYEEIEALAVVDILRRSGIDVKMVGVDGKTVKSARGIEVVMDEHIDDLVGELEMVVLPGGVPGVHSLYESDKVKALVQTCKLEDRWLAAICAAPSILGKWGILEGVEATCYPGWENELVGAIKVDKRVVTSGKIITAIGAGASMTFALELVRCLLGEEKAAEIKEAMLIE